MTAYQLITWHLMFVAALLIAVTFGSYLLDLTVKASLEFDAVRAAHNCGAC